MEVIFAQRLKKFSYKLPMYFDIFVSAITWCDTDHIINFLCYYPCYKQLFEV
uniref:Uncharacterized protein n=1 Tax=Octopus bimaculoides TaxID=37653 RepID=A0A0L8I014_OCTBM